MGFSKTVRLGLALLVLIATGMLASTAQAANFTVTNTNNIGPGSLRRAILDANASGGPDVINITAAGTVTLQNQLPAISEDLTINGPGALLFTVDVNGAGRGFLIQNGVTATVRGLKVTGASNSAFRNAGSLTLENVILDQNQANNTGGGVASDGSLNIVSSLITHNTAGTDGGGIAIKGDLNVTASKILDNTAPNKGGGIYVCGPAIAQIDQTLIVDNTANNGGGVANNQGQVTISASTVSGNHSTGPNGGGGGILNFAGQGCNAAAGDVGPSYLVLPQLVVQHSILNDNTAVNFGGGLMNYVNSQASISGSTVSGNTAGAGGGIANVEGMLDVALTTISYNSATGATNNPSVGGGVFNFSIPGATLHGTIVIANSASGNPGGGGIYNCGVACSDTTVDNVGAASTDVDPPITLPDLGDGTDSAAASDLVHADPQIYVSQLQITDSEVSGNLAPLGAGIKNGARAQLDLLRVLIKLNVAPDGAGIRNNGTGNNATLEQTTLLFNLPGGNCSGLLTSNGGNISSDTTCDGFGVPFQVGSVQTTTTSPAAGGAGSSAGFLQQLWSLLLTGVMAP